MQRLWRVGSPARRNSRALLWLVPSLQARPPTANVSTIRFVLSAKFPAERWFFIQDYEQMHTESDCCNGGNRQHGRGPKTIHSPIQPTANPTYMGLRTCR
jgi:hypothetical protein